MAHYKIKPVALDKLRDTDGLIYYMPKPYLVLTNMGFVDPSKAVAQAPTKATDTTKGNEDKGKATGHATLPDASTPKTTVTAAIIFLPDMKNPRAITVSNSIGTFKSTIQLNNGWMLTGLNGEADAKFAETITAFSGLISSVAKMGGLGLVAADDSTAPPFFYLLEMDLVKKTLRPVDPGCINELLNDARVKDRKTGILPSGCDIATED